MKKILLASIAGVVSLGLVGCAESTDEDASATDDVVVEIPADDMAADDGAMDEGTMAEDGDADEGGEPEAVMNPDGDADGPIPSD